MIETIVVKNPTRTRKWGWGWTTGVENRESGWYIPPPTVPTYTGTWNKVHEAIRKDRTFQVTRSGGTFMVTRWFYDGAPIVNADDVLQTMDDIEWSREADREMNRPWRGAWPVKVQIEIPDVDAE